MSRRLQISNIAKMKENSREFDEEIRHTLKCKKSYKRKKKNPSTSCVCKICGQTFARQRNLILHMQKHNGRKPFECHLCKKKFSRSDHLKNHVARHFKIGKHPCNQCDKVYKRADLLKYHKVNEHGSTISFKEIRSYTKASTSAQKRNSQCGVCGKFFLDEKGLKAHSKIHLMTPKHECNHCGKLFNQRSNLTVHVRQHTGTKPYKCETCSETFSTSCKLKTHMRKHTGDLLFVCDVCGKRFGEGHLLKMHMRIHENFRAYVCSYCGKSFTHSSTLRSHIRIHTGAKPYKCDLCQESFAQISSLSYHRKSHMGEKPFVCDICGNKYTRRATLNAHRVRHTGEKRFLCSHCDFKCDIASQLRKHMMHYHIATNIPSTSASNAPQNVGDLQLVEEKTPCKHLKQDPSEPLTAATGKSGVSCEEFNTIHGHHTNILSNKYQDNSESISLHGQTSKTFSHSSKGIMHKDVFSPHYYGSNSSLSKNTVSDPQTLCSDVTQSHQPSMPYVMTSMEAHLENGEPSTFPSDSFVLHVMTPRKSASELLQCKADKADTYSSDCHEFHTLPLIHPTLPLRKVCDVENLSTHPDVQSENISQLCDLSCSKNGTSTSIVQIPVSVREPLSSASNILHGKPNLHSVPSLLTQAHTSVVESNHHPIGSAQVQERNCEVSYTKENNLTQDSSQNDSQSKLSSNSDLKLLKEEMDDKRECHLGHRISVLVNSRPAQYINFEKRKEFPNESHSITVNEHFPNTQPLDFSNLNKETTMSLNKEISLKTGKTDCKSMNDSFHVSSSSEDPISSKRDTSPILEDSQSVLLILEDSYSGIGRKKKPELGPLFTSSSSPFEEGCILKKENSQDFEHILNQFSAVNRHKRKQKIPIHKPVPELRDRVKTQGQKESMNIHAAPENLSQDDSKMMTKYKCEICGKTFVRRNNFNIHMQLHRGEKSFRCPLCGKEFSRSHHMKDHLLLHSRAKELRCYHCLDEFSNPEQLEEHIQKVHNSAYPFKCNVCTFSCLELIQLKGHVSQTHAEVNFSCQVCELAFKTSISLKDHMKEHPGKNPLECQQCGKAFPQNSSLILHIRKKHSKEKLFACGVCSNSFITASELQRHMKNHTGDRPFACDQCQKVFADGKLLRRHSKIHLDERPYQCDHCPQRFKHLNTLRAHIRTHTGSKPYKCDICGEAFAQSSSLAYHQQTHDRKKMYTCHICGKSYTRMATLNIHLLQHSGRSRFQCQECAYKCNKSTAFKRHMEKCHGQETCAG